MIVRTRKNQRYTVINNTVLEDERLSWRARGIAAYLLSKPDDWEINSDYLWKQGTEGRDAVRSAMKELEECGYLVREKRRNEDGTFNTVVTLIEEPLPDNLQPTTDYQASVNQSSVNQASIVSTEYQVLNTKDDHHHQRVVPENPDAAVFRAWAENIPGTMTPILAEKLHDLIDECGAASVIHGIVTAITAGARNLKYITACARNHAQGKEPQGKKPGYAPKLTDAERSKLITRATTARASMHTAMKFNGTIDPQWQADIDKAKEMGVM